MSKKPVIKVAMDRDKIFSLLISYTLREKDKLPSECSVEEIVEGTLEAIEIINENI